MRDYEIKFSLFDNYPRWELLPAIGFGRSIFGVQYFIHFKWLNMVFEILWGLPDDD